MRRLKRTILMNRLWCVRFFDGRVTAEPWRPAGFDQYWKICKMDKAGSRKPTA